jgi:hypothetical protein
MHYELVLGAAFALGEAYFQKLRARKHSADHPIT